MQEVATKADIKVGFLCNNRCTFCVQGDKRTIYGDLDTDEVLQNLIDGRKKNNEVVITGGEPTVKKDFLLIVKKAQELGYSIIQIQTNGRMFRYLSFCKETIAAGANNFSIGIHGHTAEIHDALTDAPHSFEQTTAGIKNLVALGQFVGSNTVITQLNFKHLPEIAQFLVALGISQIQFAFVHALGTAEENFSSVVPRYAELKPYIQKAIDIASRKNVSVMTEAIPYCILEKYRNFAAERLIPRTEIFDVQKIDNYTDYRLNEGKAHGPDCLSCRFVAECEGPWKEYPQHFGWNEFVPLK